MRQLINKLHRSRTITLLSGLHSLVIFFVLFLTVSASCAVENRSLEALRLSDEFNPRDGVYYYDVFLKDMRLGKATVRMEKGDDFYRVEVKARTRNALSFLYKVKYRGEIRMTTDPVKPLQATIEEQTGSREKSVTVDFPKPNAITVNERKSKKGKQEETRQYNLESDSFIVDPFTTLFLVRALDWHAGMAEVFDVFTGKRHYELRLECQEQTQLIHEGKERDVWVIRPQAVTHDKPEEQKLADYEIVVEKGNKRKILMIKGTSKLGNLKVILQKFEHSPESS